MGSTFHAAGRRARMLGRPVANRIGFRLRLRGHDNVLEAREAVLRHVRIDVHGAGSRIVRGRQANVTISILT